MYNRPAEPTQVELQDQERGPVRLAWTYPEFNQHQRGAAWYIGFAAVAIGLLVYSIFTSNYLLAIVVILFGFIMLNYHRHEPNPVNFEIRDKGIVVGSRYLPFSSLQSFWIVYQPPHIKTLYFLRRARLRNEISIPLIEANPLQVRELLENVLSEDLEKETETPNDSLARILKIH